ncbi:hypothetical protein HN446_02690 [bacterium]|jgi:hypothetical protein|nr:hypothetical protein [bacterium]
MKTKKVIFMFVASIAIFTALFPNKQTNTTADNEQACTTADAADMTKRIFKLQVIRKVFSPLEWVGKWTKRIGLLVCAYKLFFTGLDGGTIAITIGGYSSEKIAQYFKNDIAPLYDFEAWKNLHKKEFKKKLTKICLCQPH